MSVLAERLKSPAIRLGIKQFGLVIEFADAIEAELRRRKMKPSAFADLLGKSRAWVSKVLRKKQNLTFFTAFELADALDMDVRIEVVPRRTNVILFSRVQAKISPQAPATMPPLKLLTQCDAG